MEHFSGSDGSRPHESTAVPSTTFHAPGGFPLTASPPEAAVEASHAETKTSNNSSTTRTWDYEKSTKLSVEVVETTTSRTETIVKKVTRSHPYA
jgi:hypothetical protein